MKGQGNSRYATLTSESCLTIWQLIFGDACRRSKFWVNISVMALGLLPGIARAQAVRGTLIDSPSQTNSPAISIPPAVQTVPPPTNTFVKQATGNYLQVGFDTLSAYSVKVNWWMNPTNSHNDKLEMVGQIPDAIRSLDKKAVSVQGFMMPLKQNAGLVTEFLLMRNQSSCCYGKPLQINEWIQVRMEGKGVKSMMDRLLTVCGTLQVGEKLENGNIVSIYRLDGKEIVPSDTR